MPSRCVRVQPTFLTLAREMRARARMLGLQCDRRHGGIVGRQTSCYGRLQNCLPIIGTSESSPMRKLVLTAVLAALWSMCAVTTEIKAAEIRVLSSNGMREAVVELAPQFERSTGHKVSIRYDTAAFLQRDIDRGESFDVAVMTRSQFDAVAKTGK